MENDKLYKTLLSGSANVRDDCILFSLGNINGHVDQLRAGYYGLYGGFCFGDRNAEGEWIVEYVDNMHLIVCHTQVDYILTRSCQRNFITVIRVLLGKKCDTQHKL